MSTIIESIESIFESADAKTVGKLSRDQFDEINESGAEAVAAVEATGKALSADDAQLFLQISAGGMMQLELSRLAVDNATDEEVVALAEAEVDEQTGLSAKLQEIADAKGITLPSEPDAETQSLLVRLRNLADAHFDLAYVETSGIDGHEKLDAVLSEVEEEADDIDLKVLASVAHPLVLTHLEVSRAILEKLSV